MAFWDIGVWVELSCLYILWVYEDYRVGVGVVVEILHQIHSIYDFEKKAYVDEKFAYELV